MNIKGIYQNAALSTATFSGWQGLKVFAGNPLPLIQILANRQKFYTTETADLIAYLTNAYYLEWQHSRDGISWLAIGDSVTEYSETFPHTADTTGTHYFRCIALNSYGEAASNTISIEVSPRPPSIDITASATELMTPGTSTLSASIAYADVLQWQTSEDGEVWENLIGETDIILIRSYDLEETGTHYFRCIAYGLNSASTVSNTVEIRTTAPQPTITISASAKELTSPASVTLSAEETFSTSRQWQTSEDGIEWTDLTGETAIKLTVSYTEEAAGTYLYRCTASGPGGFTESNIITIIVTAPEPEGPEQGESTA